jgi:aldose 1-epimerase
MGVRDSMIVLQAAAPPSSQLGFVSAQVLPARAMMVYQLRANLPGRGEIEVLAAPPLEEGLARLDGGPADFNGNASFSMGAAFLAPFVNRIRGRLVPDSREIETTVAGRPTRLPANGGGKAPGAEQYAIHGLMLDRAAGGITLADVEGGQEVRATLDAGNFGGRWASALRFGFRIGLTVQAFDAVVTATNTGDAPTPVGLGWHPYFNLPSGERAQGRMRVPARARLPVNNYDEVLPTGRIAPVAGTAYDFSGPQGAALQSLYLDDCFVDLVKTAGGATVCEVIDPAAGYGVRLVSDSPQITAVQTFAPPDRAMVVIEPQFSWADPYGAQWPAGVDTGMVMLQPGASVDYRVRLELFRP